MLHCGHGVSPGSLPPTRPIFSFTLQACEVVISIPKGVELENLSFLTHHNKGEVAGMNMALTSG